jgi:DNA-binding NarL/FixJ family response regulator
MLCREITVIAFATASDFILAGPGKFSLAIYHMHADAAQTGASGLAIAALMHEQQPTPVLVISDVDDSGSMARALTAGVRGYVPTINTNLRITIEIMRLVSAGGVFAPVTPSMLQQACGQTPPAREIPTDRFTPRQLTVLEHLKQGNANKVIAHKLSMSEGTVKVHVRNIMKKMRATNRTQAVFRAYSSTSGREAADGRPGVFG